MMKNRKKIGLLIIAVAFLILVIIIIMFLKKTKPIIDNGPIITSTATGTNLATADNLPVSPTSTPGDKLRNPQVYDISKEAPYKINANDAAKLAASFTERLGSYSNQSDYGNVTDLKIFMTANMKDWADKYIAELRAQKYSGQYYGIMTKSLTTKVLNYDEKTGQTEVEVMTERQESQADIISPTYFQKMTMSLVKINKEWFVDGAFWEKK